MRTRKRAILPWLFSFIGIALLVACGITVLAFAARQGLLRDEWQDLVQQLLAQAHGYLPGEDWLRYLAWLAGISGSAVGAAFTLLASWHFAEMNLPQRLKDLQDAHDREHLALQPRLIALARSGLGPVISDIETSRITLLRKWLSRWSERETARVLAASSRRLQTEGSALAAATVVAQHQQVAAHIIRGYQHASEGDDDQAFDEFEAATAVMVDDIVSRDIAAGWARKLSKPARELELLKELQHAAHARNDDLNFGRGLRREAEVLAKGITEGDWSQARQRLDNARALLLPLAGKPEAKVELGRVLTLLCEVQYRRRRTGRLDGPNRPLTVMKNCMKDVSMHRRDEEPNGEQYGHDRAILIEQLIAELRGTGDDQGDDEI